MMSVLMRRILDWTAVVLLLTALGQAVALGRAEMGADALLVPLLGQNDPPHALSGPGAADRALSVRVATVGERLTIEDLARGIWLMDQGQLADAAPLTEKEREKVQALLQAAEAERTELLAIQEQLLLTEAEMTVLGREMAVSLTPVQRAWLLENRDRISVAGVEQRYWDELLNQEGENP